MPTAVRQVLSNLWLILWMQEKINKCNYSSESYSEPWERLEFLKCYNFSHDPGGDSCICVDLFIVLHYLQWFIHHRENVNFEEKCSYIFCNLCKTCTMSSICTAFLKLDMIMWSDGDLNFFSLHALTRSRTPNTIFVNLFDFLTFI